MVEKPGECTYGMVSREGEEYEQLKSRSVELEHQVNALTGALRLAQHMRLEVCSTR